MEGEKMSIFDLMYDTYKITKPIKVIELFAGYGSQTLALKYIGANYEHHRIVEWAIPSIIAYADVHQKELPNYGKDYTKEKTKEEIANELHSMGVSANYNNPASLEQLKRIQEPKLKLIYNSIKQANNLVDISRVKAEALDITNKQFTYLLTYVLLSLSRFITSRQKSRHARPINQKRTAMGSREDFNRMQTARKRRKRIHA